MLLLKSFQFLDKQENKKMDILVRSHGENASEVYCTSHKKYAWLSPRPPPPIHLNVWGDASELLWDVVLDNFNLKIAIGLVFSNES